MEVIDNLSQFDRQIYQSPDVWYLKNGKLCKVIDPISQVHEYGEWGSDSADCDPGTIKKTAVRTYLEDVGILKPTANMNGFSIDENNGDYSEYIDTALLDCFVTEHDGDEDEDYAIQEHSFCVPSLSQEVEAEVIRLRDECYSDIESLSIDEANLRIAEFEKRAEKLISPYLGLNYSNIGYNAPQMRYVKIFSDTESNQTSAARDREKFFYDLVAEASDVRSKEALYGPMTERGDRDLTKGFFGRIHGMYEHDKEIRVSWTIDNSYDKDGNLVEESQFNKQRKAFIHKCRATGVDEETLRYTLWSWFDRTQKNSSPVFDDNGNLKFQGKNQKDSIWRQQRSDAFQDLFLTRSQWNHIYKILEITKQRIILDTKPTTEQEEIVAKLKEHLKNINTLPDLERYKKWVSFRRPIYMDFNGKKTKTLDFEKSMLDKISFKKEHMLWSVLIKKEKEFKNLLRASKLVVKQIKYTVETNKPEVIISCNCDLLVTDVPVFAALKDGNGKYFVKCECGKTIWIDVKSIKDFDNLESYSRN
jgi:hypothetical protein